MNDRDLCFLGLLALACRLSESTEEQREPPAAHCPRDPAHAAVVRADGALWCRACDQAFYPTAEEWDAAPWPGVG